MIGQRADMALRASSGDDHMVGQSGFSLQINGDDVLRQIIIETGQNHIVKRAVLGSGDFIFAFGACALGCLSVRVFTSQLTLHGLVSHILSLAQLRHGFQFTLGVVLKRLHLPQSGRAFMRLRAAQ